MLKRERQAYTLHQINRNNNILSADVRPDINITNNKLTTGLRELEKARKPMMIIDGAMAPSFPSHLLANGELYFYACKRIITDKAAFILQDCLLDNVWLAVDISRAIVEPSQRLVCLTIAKKIKSKRPIEFCKYLKADRLITELLPENAPINPKKEAGIDVLKYSFAN